MISPERSQELLRVYTATRCVSAFHELMAGWTDLVYATALRVARGEKALAEDVTQIVFSRLAAAPGKVNDGRALGAWLHAAATGSTLAALRREARRRRREETSQDLVMHTSEPPSPDAAVGHHELTQEIDGALRKLPPQDSQLLLMRFWQQQDWRSIGRHLGLTDDTAQKRMNRALERLRRILARRGITSTAGVLSSVLTATVPRELPAALVLNITTASELSTAVPSAALTTVAMTTKTKVTLTAALALAIATPLVLQQQRIVALNRELQSLRESALAPAVEKALAAVNAGQDGAGGAVSAPGTTATDLLSRKRTSVSETMVDEGGPHDYETLKGRQIEEKLAVLSARLSLTPEQEAQIEQALDYGQMKTKMIDNDLKIFRASSDDKRKMEEGIRGALTAAQQEEYDSFQEEEMANAVEAVANRELSSLQSMTTLSLEQKDRAFAALAEIASREVGRDLPIPGEDRDDAGRELEARWTDRLDALAAILTPQQMAIYRQAGNPFVARGPGG